MTTTTPRPETPRTRTATTRTASRRDGSGQVGSTLRAIWNSGDQALQYTILAVACIALLGAIVVPMSMPEAAPQQDRASLLAERYLASLPADADKPALQQVVADYGTDGGGACGATVAETYEGLFTSFTRANGTSGTRLDRAALAQTTHMMQTYCPARGDALQAHADKRTAALKRKRAA